VEDAQLVEESLAAGHHLEEILIEILLAEINTAPAAVAEEVAGIMRYLRGQQHEIVVMKIVHVIFNHIPARTHLYEGKLKVRMGMVRGHDITGFACTAVRHNPAYLVCSNSVFVVHSSLRYN
jgi:hypothetical protein